MIERLKLLFSASPAEETESDSEANLRMAEASLMFVAAMMDDSIGPEERREIDDMIRERFDLMPAEAAAVMAEAERAAEDATHILRFTAEIKAATDDDERMAVMERLWRVICADGVVHDREANLMRRIAGLLYVTDKDSGIARQRALAACEPEPGNR
jgi:uncharacterized tellurite resistance protein B-like protein